VSARLQFKVLRLIAKLKTVNPPRLGELTVFAW
jgi:hypothetical protein